MHTSLLFSYNLKGLHAIHIWWGTWDWWGKKKDLKRSKKGATRLVLFSYVIFLNNYLLIAIRHVVRPQWWSFADMSQQGLDFSKKICKIKMIFCLTFTDVHRGRQKVPKSDFQSQFSMSKIIQIFLIFFSLKNISLEEGFLLLSFFENFNFWTTLFSKMVPNFWRSVWTSVKVKSKNYFYFTDFFAKIYSLLTHVRSTPPLRSH